MDVLDRQGLRRAVHSRRRPAVQAVGQVHQPAPVAFGAHRLQHHLEPDQDRGGGPWRNLRDEVLAEGAQSLAASPAATARRRDRACRRRSAIPANGRSARGSSPASKRPSAGRRRPPPAGHRRRRASPRRSGRVPASPGTPARPGLCASVPARPIPPREFGLSRASDSSRFSRRLAARVSVPR